MPPVFDDLQLLRSEIAATAARLIARDGASYSTAKRKAARQILGERQANTGVLPDNAQVEHELRIYHTLFLGATQAARLFHLRCVALEVMQALAEFNPYLTGAVLNGTAGAHADIHLQLFADSVKEVEIFLLNRALGMRMSETPHFKGPRHDPVDTVSFVWRDEAVHAELYHLDDLRGALKIKPDGKANRADEKTLRALLASQPLPNEAQA